MLEPAATGPRCPHTPAVRSPACRRSRHDHPTGDPDRAGRGMELRGWVTPTADAPTTGRLRMSKDEPRFVQLLTPDGVRVNHPDYDVDFTDEELRGLYRDLVMVRRLDAEGTALQRQG